jgi:hypothetical protein
MRGQTTLDFALGISIFLVVILFVFTFVPGLLDPFALNNEEDTVLVGQVADRLSQDTLGDPTQPYILDRHCTVSFFDDSTDAPDRCRYGDGDLHDRLNIPATKELNVTIERNSTVGSTSTDILCWDENEEELTAADSCVGTQLSVGASPTANGRNPSTITARRVVSLNDEDVTLKVVVW